MDRRKFLRAATVLGAGSMLGGLQHSAGRQAQAAGRDVAWLEEIQRRPDVVPANAPVLTPLLSPDVLAQPRAQAREAWTARARELKRLWNEFLGRLTIAPPRPQYRVISEDEAPGGVRRQLVEYEVEPNINVQAYLLWPGPQAPRPTAASGKRPGVVVFHSTFAGTIRQPAGLQGDPEDFFGLILAQLGYVTLCPRNFLWQDAAPFAEQVTRFQARHPRAKGMAKMLWDAERAVDVLAAIPEVDPARLGAIGHSLGAKEVLYLAAFDPRIAVTVSSEGGIGLGFSNWEAPWYLGPEIRRPEFSRENHEVLAFVAPRPFLLLGGQSADGDRGWPFIEAALAIYRLHDGPARVGQFNHRQGHSVPPPASARINEWFQTYLPV